MPAAEQPSEPTTTIEHLGSTTDGRSSFVRVCCEVTPVSETSAPEWIHVVPEGPYIEARDGRSFRFSDPAELFSSSELPLLIDWEHLSERPDGSTRAAGWVNELRYVGVERSLYTANVDLSSPATPFPRPGLWARVDWTPEGKGDVESRAYRYLSPVMLIDSESREIQQLISVALTNTPALRMHAVEQFRERLSARFGSVVALPTPEERMKADSFKALCTALAVAEDATDNVIVEAASQLHSLKETCTKLTADLATASARADTAEAKLAENEKAQFTAEVERVLDDASKAGKVPPAAREAYRALCSSRANLELFTSQILPSLPELCGPAPKSAPAPSAPDLSGLDVETLRRAGLSDERIRAAIELNRSTRASRLGEDDSE